MADLDGVVRIGTEIDDSGFKKGMQDLGKTAEKSLDTTQKEIKTTEKGIDSLGDTAKNTKKDIDKFGDGLDDGTKAAKQFGNEIEKAGKSTSSFGDFLKADLIGGGIQSLVSGFMGAVEQSAEFTKSLSKLQINAETAGNSFDSIQDNFRDFVALTGQADSSAEALSNLLQTGFDDAAITQTVEALSGAVTKFPDTLNIESLADGLQETLATGEATGQFGELLDRLGIGADNFSAALANTTSEAERQQLVLDTLSGAGLNDLYQKYSEANAATLEFNQAQADLNIALSNFVSGSLPLAADGLSVVADNALRLSEAFKTGGLESFLTEAQNIATEFSNKIVQSAPQIVSSGYNFIKSFFDGIIQEIPISIQRFSVFFEEFANYIIENIPTVISSAQEFLSQIADYLSANLPILVNSLTGVFANIGNLIKDNLPSFLSSALDLLQSFSQTLRDNAGILIDGALSMAKSIAQGISDSLPVIIEKVPQIVTNIASVINDNAPKLLVTAGQIILTLAKGLINAIPTLVQNIPQIIQAIVAVFTAFNWAGLGKSIITFLKNGITSMKGAAAEAGQNIVTAIKDAIKNLPTTLKNIGTNAATSLINALKTIPSKALEIGKNIIAGLKQGITNGVGEVVNKVVDFGGSIINGLENVFDINSPSKVMAYIGSMLTAGLIQGIKKDEKKVQQAITQPVEKAKKEIKNIGLAKGFSDIIKEAQETARKEAQSYSDVGTIMIEALQQGVDDNKENAIATIDELLNETIEAMEDEEQKEAARAAGDEIMQSYKEALEAGAKNAKEYISDSISKITNEFQTQYDDLLSKQQALEENLGGTYLFEVKDGQVFVEDVQQSIDTLNAYGEALEQLKEKGASAALLEEVGRLDATEGLAVIEHLLGMTDEDFKLLNEKWAEKQELAAEIAAAFYEDQMSELKEGFINEMMTTLEAVPDDVHDIGVDTVEGWIDGMNEKLPSLVAKAQELARQAISAMKSELGIASPSKEGIYIGEMMNAGVAKGLDDSAPMVQKSIENMGFFDAAKAVIPKMQSAVAATMAAIAPMPAYAGGGITRTESVQTINRNTVQTVEVVANGSGIFDIVQKEGKRRGNSLITGRGLA